MHPVEDEDAPCRSQTEGAVRGWLLTFVPRYKSGSSTGMGVSHAGARRPTGALGGVNRAYRYRPSGRRDGSLYAGTDLMVTLRLLRPAKGDVPCAVETQRQLGSRLRNHL